MIQALPTSIRLPNSQALSIRWGLPEKREQDETIMVGHPLRHQSAVDVSVVGNKVTEEESYKGTLTAIFADGARRQRKIEGVLQRK